MTTLAWAERAARATCASVEVVTPASASLLRLDDLRAHVSQHVQDDDAMLEDLSMAAGTWAESYLGRRLLETTLRAWYDAPLPGPVVLLPEPATAVTSVTAYSDTDAASVVSGTAYQVDRVAIPTRLVLRAGQTWPSPLRPARAVAVEYTAGWATPEAVPLAIKQALKLLVGHWYEHRVPVQMGGHWQVLPYGVEALLMPYRVRTGAV